MNNKDLCDGNILQIYDKQQLEASLQNYFNSLS